MNKLYEKTSNVEGRVYRYDSDQDIYYRVSELVSWDAWGWLAVILLLAAVGLYLEFWPIR
jgi:hypothetical protein